MFGLVWRILSGVATALGVLVAERGLQTVWKAVAGDAPPEKPESPETRLLEAVLWAALAGAAINVGRVVATRIAAGWFTRHGNGLPKQLRVKD